MIKVQVPATSANLGVGYDCLGVALDEFATITFEEIKEGVRISGCDPMYCNEVNLVYQAFLKGLEHMQKTVCGISIHIESPIPTARGLGSSAICIVAGLYGANALFNNPMNKYEIFALATQMEGHCDNVAPAIFGALCVSFVDDGKPHMIRYGVKSTLRFIAMIPDFEISTKQARKVLPDTMCYDDAVYQMGRCSAFAKAMEIGNGLIIKNACHDKMQEPYRALLIPQYDQVKTLCEEAGAMTLFISGSGSCMIALSDDDEVAAEIKENMEKIFTTWTIRVYRATYEGARSEVA